MKAFFSKKQKEWFAESNSMPKIRGKENMMREIFYVIDGEVKEVTEVGDSSNWPDAVCLGEPEKFSHLGKVITPMPKIYKIDAFDFDKILKKLSNKKDGNEPDTADQVQFNIK